MKKLRGMSVIELRYVLNKAYELSIDDLRKGSKIINMQLLEESLGYATCKIKNAPDFIELLIMKGIHALVIECKEDEKKNTQKVLRSKKENKT